MNIEKAIKTVEDLLVLVFGGILLMGAFAVAIGFLAGASLMSWAFVTWAWGLIPS
jgi:hypothetical protein